jgi:hypothetical protein
LVVPANPVPVPWVVGLVFGRPGPEILDAILSACLVATRLVS